MAGGWVLIITATYLNLSWIRLEKFRKNIKVQQTVRIMVQGRKQKGRVTEVNDHRVWVVVEGGITYSRDRNKVWPA